MNKTIARNDRQEYSVKACGWTDAQDTFLGLMNSLSFLISEADGTKEEKDKALKDVITDVVIPKLKDMYIESTEYILFDGRNNRGPLLVRSHYPYGIRNGRDYDITEDEEEDSEDE